LKKFFSTEFKFISEFLRGWKQEILVIGFAALFIVLGHYHPILNETLTSLVYYAVLPVLVIAVILRKNPLDFGFRLGNHAIWLRYVLITVVAAAIILGVASMLPSLTNYYTQPQFKPLSYSLTYTVILFSQEYLYRGFLLFGLKDKLKEGAILVQMIPFVLLHLGKPEIETISTVLTGIYFGWVVYRGKSYWPAFIIHLFINIFFVAIVNIKH
jgi:uncharacterized protein